MVLVYLFRFSTGETKLLKGYIDALNSACGIMELCVLFKDDSSSSYGSINISDISKMY